jgi:hypothetical protein
MHSKLAFLAAPLVFSACQGPNGPTDSFFHHFPMLVTERLGVAPTKSPAGAECCY